METLFLRPDGPAVDRSFETHSESRPRMDHVNGHPAAHSISRQSAAIAATLDIRKWTRIFTDSAGMADANDTRFRQPVMKALMVPIKKGP
jgi:hypothetical protein